MKEQRIRNEPARFWVSCETNATVRRIAESTGRSVSSVYRDLVEKGLVAGGYRSGGSTMAELVRHAAEDALKPYMERLAAMTAKGTQIGAAAFFLAAYNGRQALTGAQRAQYDELAALSRKLGVEYLKLSRDTSIDDFLASGLSRMGRDTL